MAWHDHAGSSAVDVGATVASTRRAGGPGGGLVGCVGAAPVRVDGSRSSQASFQYTRHRAWHPPCAEPSQRTPARCTTSSILRVVPLVPPVLTVSHVRCTTASTTSVRPRYCHISGMNGKPSCRPSASSVARMASASRTRTRSPTR